MNTSQQYDRYDKPLLNFLILFCQGIIVGTVTILPGASGGGSCVAFGLFHYKPMMTLLAHPIQNFKHYYEIFIPFFIGWIVGFLLFVRATVWLFDLSPNLTMALFAGLICGTIPNLIKESYESNSSQSWSPFVISMIVAFALFWGLQVGEVNLATPSTNWYIFCGMIWGLSFIVPGLSSSSIVTTIAIFFGLYQPMTVGIAGLDISVILPMLCGLFIIVLPCVKLANNLFERQYSFITKIVLGVLLSSTLMIIPTAITSAFTAFLLAVCFIFGLLLAIKMSNTAIFSE